MVRAKLLGACEILINPSELTDADAGEENFAQWAIRECFQDHEIGAIVESDFVKMLGQNFTRRISARSDMLIIISTEDATKIIDAIGAMRPKILD